MEADEVRRHLEETGALRTGHFQLSSGLHSGEYVQCAQVLAQPARASLLGAAIGALWTEESVELVVGPALGGVIIAHEVARYLGTPCFFSERKDGTMTLRRGFTVESGVRALVVEDVVTTGGSAREVVELLTAQGAAVVGVSSIVWRAPAQPRGPTPFGDTPYRSLLEMTVEAWKPDECPHCQQGQAMDQPGSRFSESRSAGGHAP